MNRAVFLDRDGVINELVYYPEQGTIDSPFTATQLKLLPGVGQAVGNLSRAGYKIIMVSNQPGIAKGHHTMAAFQEIAEKMRDGLASEGGSLDGEYYCFHHPNAAVISLREECDCRKPEPGLLLRAAGEMNIDLPRSWMVGDGITDIQAGKSAGCRTILLGRMKCELCHLIEEQNARPDAIAASLAEAAGIIINAEGKHGDIHRFSQHGRD